MIQAAQKRTSKQKVTYRWNDLVPISGGDNLGAEFEIHLMSHRDFHEFPLVVLPFREKGVVTIPVLTKSTVAVTQIELSSLEIGTEDTTGQSSGTI